MRYIKTNMLLKTEVKVFFIGTPTMLMIYSLFLLNFKAWYHTCHTKPWLVWFSCEILGWFMYCTSQQPSPMIKGRSITAINNNLYTGHSVLTPVHPTSHTLYMSCMNVSMYILCCQRWHAAGTSSCEAFSLCVCMCVCVVSSVYSIQ